MHEESFMPLFGTFGWISILLIAGVILRAKIGFFQKFLFPAAIIGGLAGFVLKSLGVIAISHDTFVLFAIHLFTISFISIGLTGTGRKKSAGPGASKSVVRGMFWMACVYVAAISIQALSGGIVIYLTNATASPSMYPGLGMLVGTGFAQGAGQTVALASVWENSFQIQNAVSVGLTFAAVGYLIASLIGVPLANWGVRKKVIADPGVRISRPVLSGLFLQKEQKSAGKLVTHSGNIDGLALQLALVMAVYFLTYYECLAIKSVLPKTLQGLAFGLMFLWGIFTAILVRAIIDRLGILRFIDTSLQRRITGVSVDYMVVATMVGVEVAAITNHLAPLLLVCIIAGVLTTLLIVYFGRRLPEYGFERMLAIFGTATGTGASGLMLLRIVDPDFKTPAAAELGLYNAFSIVLMPILVVAYPLPSMNPLILYACLTGYVIVALVLLKVFGFWKKPIW
jgi:ESS family glutamate:Na+ symporter